MINQEVKDLINDVWRECDKDDTWMLEVLENTEGELAAEAASVVRFTMKHGREWWAE